MDCFFQNAFYCQSLSRIVKRLKAFVQRGVSLHSVKDRFHFAIIAVHPPLIVYTFMIAL